MNKARREAIDVAIAKIEEGKSELETLMEEEQDYLDNMPENLQSSEKGESAQAAIDALEGAVASLDDAVTSAQEAQG
jgi:hypothetical protein